MRKQQIYVSSYICHVRMTNIYLELTYIYGFFSFKYIKVLYYLLALSNTPSVFFLPFLKLMLLKEICCFPLKRKCSNLKTVRNLTKNLMEAIAT